MNRSDKIQYFFIVLFEVSVVVLIFWGLWKLDDYDKKHQTTAQEEFQRLQADY